MDNPPHDSGTPPARRGTSLWNVAAALGALILAAVLIWFLLRTDRNWQARGLGKSFESDFTPLSQVDPSLIIASELKPIPVDLTDPTGIAVGDGDRLFVCGDRAIVVLSATGTPERRIELSEHPACVAAGPDGRAYVGVGNHIEVVSPETWLPEAWLSPATNAVIACIAADSNGVWATDAINARVIRFNLSGDMISTWGGFTLFSSAAFDAAIGPDRSLWVANPGGRELRKYTDDGRLVAVWKRQGRTIEGFSGCCNPMHIAIRKDGSIVTSEKNILRIKLLSASGDLAGVVAAPDRFAPGTRAPDLAVDSSGRILALDDTMKAVRVFAITNRLPMTTGGKP